MLTLLPEAVGRLGKCVRVVVGQGLMKRLDSFAGSLMYVWMRMSNSSSSSRSSASLFIKVWLVTHNQPHGGFR